MNYKKIITSRNVRVLILTFTSWIPDRIMVSLQYFVKTRKFLNLKSPKRFSEKIQAYKLHYRDPLMLTCTDKFEVRKYVADKIGSNYLIPLIGIYNNTNEITFDKLPTKFVAKTTDGGGGNQVFVCKDKHIVSEIEFKKQLNKWMTIRKGRKHFAREWAYDNNFPRRILIEELIGEETNDLIDYKFLCFNGKVEYIYSICNRKLGQSAQLGIYDASFNKINVYRNDECPQEKPTCTPINFAEMITIAEKLSKSFPHVRVDLYNVNGRIYFGELTFYDGSGYMTFSPDDFDFEIGNKFNI